MKLRSWLYCFLMMSMVNATIINVPTDPPTVQAGIEAATSPDTAWLKGIWCNYGLGINSLEFVTNSVGLGNEANLSLVIRNNWMVSIGYSDAISSTRFRIALFADDSSLTIAENHVLFGKKFDFEVSGVAILVGISRMSWEWEYEYSNLLGPNERIKRKRNMIGLLTRGDLFLYAHPSFGACLSVFANLNQADNYIGITAGIFLGKMR